MAWFKVLVALGGAAASAMLWAWRRASARKRLGEMDRGERCLGCEGTNVTLRDGVIQCMSCGHAQKLADIAAVQLTDAEIAAITRPK